MDELQIKSPTNRLAGVCLYGNAAIVIFFALYFLIVPGFMVMRHLSDPELKGSGVPAMAWQLHHRMSPDYARWARERVEANKAANLDLHNISGTEWPVFGTVFYLWATEALQAAWDQDNSLWAAAPKDYAQETIEAAVDLVLDPGHHSWVQRHWGNDYLHEENVFFRMLLIAALTSHENLIGDGRHRDMLKDQVENLMAELDASPMGVLDDYPGQCYPPDVLVALACIQRADKVLGTDHSASIQRAARAFEGQLLDKRGMIPFRVNRQSGKTVQPARASATSFLLLFAHELWPDKAKAWYEGYENHYWQSLAWADGFREFPAEIEGRNFLYDVDAGPVLFGFSPSGNAFGVAAAKINGRLDHAYTLGAQVLAASWPLPNGRLLGPWLLSDREHAPWLGEVCLLYTMSQSTAPGMTLQTGGRKPLLIAIGYLIYFGVGGCFLFFAIRSMKTWQKTRSSVIVYSEAAQVGSWVFLLLVAGLLALLGHILVALIALVVAQLFPVIKTWG
ncbi:MAG: hypothetical protein AAF492_11180 [Verrucomicrobiota bacterium]